MNRAQRSRHSDRFVNGIVGPDKSGVDWGSCSCIPHPRAAPHALHKWSNTHHGTLFMVSTHQHIAYFSACSALLSFITASVCTEVMPQSATSIATGWLRSSAAK